MTEFVYPKLGEKLYREVLPNGLTVAVVPRPGFARKLAYRSRIDELFRFQVRAFRYRFQGT